MALTGNTGIDIIEIFIDGIREEHALIVSAWTVHCRWAWIDQEILCGLAGETR